MLTVRVFVNTYTFTYKVEKGGEKGFVPGDLATSIHVRLK